VPLDLASVLERRAEGEPALQNRGATDDLFDGQAIPQGSRVMADGARYGV
jgi:hypothetical protein